MNSPVVFRAPMVAGCLIALFTAAGSAADFPSALRAAVAKSLPLLEQSAKTSLELRKNCFTCHNQGLPAMALITARSRGFAIDEINLRQQLQSTADFLARNHDNYRQGRGQAGQVFMAGYALWALNSGDWPADETTAAVAEYFLKYQSDDDHWSTGTDRPPSEVSSFTATFLGLNSLAAFSTSDQRERAQLRRAQVLDWLRSAAPEDTEDRVFRLWAFRTADATPADIQSATQSLLEIRQSDGGWSQSAAMESDSYATATALVALHRAANFPTDDSRYRQGIDFLLQQQLADGSWHVVSHSKPFQTYYESGYPHGKDQFISITAAAWATMALTLALPEDPPADALQFLK